MECGPEKLQFAGVCDIIKIICMFLYIQNCRGGEFVYTKSQLRFGSPSNYF